MPQHSLSLPNADGATVRAGINAALLALVSLSSGATAPATTVAGQLWWDTTNDLVKIRNGTNTAWIVVAAFDGVTWIPYRGGVEIPVQPSFGTAASRDVGTAAGNVPQLITGGLLARALLQTMVGATDTVAGQSGVVPAPPMTGLDLFLHRNGSWQPANPQLTGNPSSYVRIPTTSGDSLLQWGIGPGAPTGQVAITFPLAYASDPVVMATPTTPGASRVASIRTLSTAGVTIRVTDINNGVSSEDVHWLALGVPA